MKTINKIIKISFIIPTAIIVFPFVVLSVILSVLRVFFLLFEFAWKESDSLYLKLLLIVTKYLTWIKWKN